MSRHVCVAFVLALLAGIELCGQVCTTQSYSVAQGTAETARAAIVQTIERASRSLDVAVSSLADGEIADAVVRALRRGISVRVILPASARTEVGSQYGTLASGGVSLKLVPASTRFTYRFAVVDGTTVITGSYEWAGGTRQAAYGTLTVIRCTSSATGRSTADEFAGDFDRLWDLLPGVQTAAKMAGTPPVSMSITIQEVDCDGQCILLFNRSTETVSIGGWVITDSEGRYLFPEGTELAPGELYRLCFGALNPIDVFLLYLDPEHDEVYLMAPDGTLVDQVLW